MTPYMAMHFFFCPENNFDPFSISTLLGESIVARKINRDCVVFILQRATLVDLIKLDIIDFDFILGRNWLYSFYASLDCRTQNVSFHFPNELLLK